MTPEERISELEGQLKVAQTQCGEFANLAGEKELKLEEARAFLRELSQAKAVNGKIQFGWSVNAKHLLESIK